MKIINYFDLGFHNTPRTSECQSVESLRTFRIPVPSAKSPGKGKQSSKIAVIIISFIAVVVVAISQSFFFYAKNDIDNKINQPVLPPVLLPLAVLLAMALLLGTLAFILHHLRKIGNQLYWQLACWFLVTIGILLRPSVVSGADPLQTTIKGAVLAGCIALGVFPGLMRLLNKLKPEPGLMHVALPFALGFFLDIAQVMAKAYVPFFAWLR